MAKQKISGAQFKAFYSNEDPDFWPKDSYVDDTSFTVNGAVHEDAYADPSEFPDDALITIESGYIVHSDGSTKSLAREFARWARAQSMVSVIVQLPKEREAELRAFVSTLGGNVN